MLAIFIDAFLGSPTCTDLKSTYQTDCCGRPNTTKVPTLVEYASPPCWMGKTYTTHGDYRHQDETSGGLSGANALSPDTFAWIMMNGYYPEQPCRKQGGTWYGTTDMGTEAQSCANTGPYNESEFPIDGFESMEEATADLKAFYNCTGSDATGDPRRCKSTLSFDADGRSANLFMMRMCATRTGEHSVLLKVYTLMNLIVAGGGGDPSTVDPCRYTPAAAWNSPTLFGSLFDQTPEETLLPAVVMQASGIYQAGKTAPYFPPDVPADKRTMWDWAGSTMFSGFQMELFFDASTCIPKPAYAYYKQNDPTTFASDKPQALRNGQPITDQPYWTTHVIDRPGTPGHGKSLWPTKSNGKLEGRWDELMADHAIGKQIFSPA